MSRKNHKERNILIVLGVMLFLIIIAVFTFLQQTAIIYSSEWNACKGTTLTEAYSNGKLIFNPLQAGCDTIVWSSTRGYPSYYPEALIYEDECAHNPYILYPGTDSELSIDTGCNKWSDEQGAVITWDEQSYIPVDSKEQCDCIGGTYIKAIQTSNLEERYYPEINSYQLRTYYYYKDVSRCVLWTAGQRETLLDIGLPIGRVRGEGEIGRMAYVVRWTEENNDKDIVIDFTECLGGEPYYYTTEQVIDIINDYVEVNPAATIEEITQYVNQTIPVGREPEEKALVESEIKRVVEEKVSIGEIDKDIENIVLDAGKEASNIYYPPTPKWLPWLIAVVLVFIIIIVLISRR